MESAGAAWVDMMMTRLHELEKQNMVLRAEVDILRNKSTYAPGFSRPHPFFIFSVKLAQDLSEFKASMAERLALCPGDRFTVSASPGDGAITVYGKIEYSDMETLQEASHALEDSLTPEMSCRYVEIAPEWAWPTWVSLFLETGWAAQRYNSVWSYGGMHSEYQAYKLAEIPALQVQLFCQSALPSFDMSQPQKVWIRELHRRNGTACPVSCTR